MDVVRSLLVVVQVKFDYLKTFLLVIKNGVERKRMTCRHNCSYHIRSIFLTNVSLTRLNCFGKLVDHLVNFFQHLQSSVGIVKFKP